MPDLGAMSAVQLAQLDREEQVLLEELERVNPKTREPEERSISLRYEKIHAQYAELALAVETPEIVATEALKRALFIQWYAVSEPSWLSGISSIDDASAASILLRLDALVASDRFDEELQSMLRWYVMLTDWHFTRARWLIAWIARQDPLSGAPTRETSMENRGQMGVYWSGLTEHSV